MIELSVALAVTAVSVPLVMRLMQSKGVVDVPKARSSHTRPVPRGGGLACIVGVAVALVVVGVQGNSAPCAALAVVAGIALVGYLDDRRSLPAGLRLGFQLLAGATMGATVGGGWWIVAGVVTVPVVVNAVNFMDGVNGITSLSMTVWGVTAFAVGSASDVSSLAVVGAVTTGAALGFLPWNLPGRIFLGDSGSYLFGGLAACGLLVGWNEGAPVALLAAPLFLYLLDVTVAILKRAIRREQLFAAHRCHVYQRLANEVGVSHTVVATTVALASAVITVSWLAPSAALALTVTLLVSAGYLMAPRLLGARPQPVPAGHGDQP